MDSKIRAPVLDDTEPSAVRAFLVAYGVYRPSGKKNMLDCIAPPVWNLLKLKLQHRDFSSAKIATAEEREGQPAEAALVQCLRASCAPKTFENALCHFSDVTLRLVSEDAALHYIEAFRVRKEELQYANSPLVQDPTFLLRQFEMNILHPALNRELHARRPSTLEEIKTKLLDAVDYLQDSQEQSLATLDLIASELKITTLTSTPTSPADATGNKFHSNNTSHTWEFCSRNPDNHGKSTFAVINLPPPAAVTLIEPQQQQSSEQWKRVGSRLERSAP